MASNKTYSTAAKPKIWPNISLCGEIMKLGTLVGDSIVVIFRLGPNSEMSPGGRHLEFKMAPSVDMYLPITLNIKQIEK